MDRRKYQNVMLSLCAGLIAAVFFYIRTELRLNQSLETIREAACMENLQEPDREDTGEPLYAAGQDTYMSKTEEDQKV